jgi:hypothetical protein
MESFKTEGAWRGVLLSSIAQNTMISENSLPPGFQDMLEFGLIEALMGRRSRRFFMGAEIPDGVLAYKSRHKPVPSLNWKNSSWSQPAAATQAGTT